MPTREYYLNADFDASLRGKPTLLETRDSTYVHEMAWHYLFAAGGEDSLILHTPLPGDFLAYIAEKGLALPSLIRHPDFSPDAEFLPFGWNAHAIALAGRYRATSPHPGPDAVRVANSRAFSLALEREWAGESAEPAGGADPRSLPEYGTLVDTLDGLDGFLRAHADAGGWVAKGDHGHAGIANRRLPPGPLSQEDREAAGRLLEDHGRLVVEPWHERLLDMSVGFHVDRQGAVAGFRGHELLNSRDGAFLGVKIALDRHPPEPWRPALAASAERLARALHAVGYFGPVSADAYVYRTTEGPRLRPLVDLNARQSMAQPAHGLALRLPGRILLWMWAKPRKLKLPDDYRALDEKLGECAFQSRTGTGVLAVSPMRREPGRRSVSEGLRPGRISFAFIAADENELAHLQSGFSRALGRN